MGWWPFGKKKKDETVDGILSQSATQNQPANADATSNSDPANTVTNSAPTDIPADTSSQGLSDVPSPLNPDTDTLKPANDPTIPTTPDTAVERDTVINLPEHPAAADTSDGPESTPPVPLDQQADSEMPPAAPTPVAADDTNPDQPTPPAQP